MEFHSLRRGTERSKSVLTRRTQGAARQAPGAGASTKVCGGHAPRLSSPAGGAHPPPLAPLQRRTPAPCVEHLAPACESWQGLCWPFSAEAQPSKHLVFSSSGNVVVFVGNSCCYDNNNEKSQGPQVSLTWYTAEKVVHVQIRCAFRKRAHSRRYIHTHTPDALRHALRPRCVSAPPQGGLYRSSSNPWRPAATSRSLCFAASSRP